MFEEIKRPEEMAPSRSPIHFTNEREVAASPETIWSLLVGDDARSVLDRAGEESSRPVLVHAREAA